MHPVQDSERLQLRQVPFSNPSGTSRVAPPHLGPGHPATESSAPLHCVDLLATLSIPVRGPKSPSQFLMWEPRPNMGSNLPTSITGRTLNMSLDLGLPASCCFQSSWLAPCALAQMVALDPNMCDLGQSPPNGKGTSETPGVTVGQGFQPGRLSPSLQTSSCPHLGLAACLHHPPHWQPGKLAGYRASRGDGGPGTEFSWEGKKQSGGESMGCTSMGSLPSWS